MTQHDSLTPALASPSASLSTSVVVCRFIVLIPAMDWDYNLAMRRVWELATASGSGVLLLSLCANAHQELSLRRSLSTVSAMLQDSGIPAEVGLEYGTNWVELVKRKHQIGDSVICFAGERTGPLHQPLSQILQSSLEIPVYIVPGPSFEERTSDWRSGLPEWMGHLVIILGFGLLQIHIVRVQGDAIQTIMLLLSLIPEFWLIQVWNHFFI